MLSRDEMIALIDPETRPATLELIREGGYMGITGDMGACMALNDACKRASAELRAAREINGQPLSSGPGWQARMGQEHHRRLRAGVDAGLCSRFGGPYRRKQPVFRWL